MTYDLRQTGKNLIDSLTAYTPAERDVLGQIMVENITSAEQAAHYAAAHYPDLPESLLTKRAITVFFDRVAPSIARSLGCTAMSIDLGSQQRLGFHFG